MGAPSEEELRISPRLKQALVADLVMGDLTKDADHWLLEPLTYERDWTEHLGRQLGMRSTCGPGGIHDTLLLIVRELDEMTSAWPPNFDSTVCRELAHQATKYLNGLELFATLAAGPAHWGRLSVEACKFERLPVHLQPILERALAAELSRMIEQWVRWDIRQLRDRRHEAIAVEKARAAEADRPPRTPFKRPTGRDRADRVLPLYRPPGRT